MRIVEGSRLSLAQAVEVGENPRIYVQELRDQALYILAEYISTMRRALGEFEDGLQKRT
jgi:hypothetical protein